MLAFITTLRHPQNSVDYGRVEMLLRETLHSVAQQTSDEYVIIIVGNQRPQFELPERTHFVPVEFPPPAPPTGAKTAREPFVWDKGTKLGIGLIEAQKHSPTHVMIFDADDFVHRDLAGFVHERPYHSGWVIREGWMYSSSRNSYVRQDGFNRTCGTSFIIPFETYEVPVELTVSASQTEIAEGFGDRLSTIMGAHRNAVAWHQERGRELETFPYRAAVYHVDTGENHSGKSLAGVAHPLDPMMTIDFGIASSRGRISTLWSAFGPVAVAESAGDLSRRAVRRVRRLISRQS